MENKKPQPRVISAVINRQTKTLIEIDYSLNEEGWYQATCYGRPGQPHGCYANSNTLKSIKIIGTDPLGWCQVCQQEEF